MSKRCPDCRRLNDDERMYCSFCGEPLDPNVRMIKSLEKEMATPSKAEEQPAPRQDDDNDDYIPPLKSRRQEKSSAAPWVLLLLAAAAALLFFLIR